MSRVGGGRCGQGTARAIMYLVEYRFFSHFRSNCILPKCIRRSSDGRHALRKARLYIIGLLSSCAYRKCWHKAGGDRTFTHTGKRIQRGSKQCLYICGYYFVVITSQQAMKAPFLKVYTMSCRTPYTYFSRHVSANPNP